MKKSLARVKEFWSDHKVAIMTTTLVAASTTIMVQGRALQEHNKFLKEKGLYDEYYDMSFDISTE